jgi:hypothetical protein
VFISTIDSYFLTAISINFNRTEFFRRIIIE